MTNNHRPSLRQKSTSRASPYPRSWTKAPSPGNSSSEPSRSKISYEKNGHTDRIIEWLTNNVNDRISLFSDNVQNASAEGRRLKKSKTSKLFYYRKIANFIFEADPEEKDNYALEPDKYAKSVENHIHGLKQKYRDFNKELGQTGA